MRRTQKKAPEPLGIYVHIPFCRSKCAYCDFYSLAGAEDRMEEYQKALLAHIRETAPLAGGYQADTVYFGGGTPSFYGEKRLVRLLAGVRRAFRTAEDGEITLEANPDSVTRPALKRLRRAGFNRLSLGMQSASAAELAAVGRPHTPEQTGLAVRAAREAGFQNLSLDLIYGLPGQTADSWRQTVEHALALGPEHLSCYGLKVEEGTPLARRVEAGEVLPDDDAQAELYLWTVERLERAGYGQYEISNFARPGFASRHNLKYWQLRPYLGFGPGAHSDLGNRRYSFVRDLDGYIRGALRGGRIIDEDCLISRRERGSEYLMLGLRTAWGVEAREYCGGSYMDFAPIEDRLRQFAAHGWAREREGRWSLTPAGLLVSNRLIGDLLERQRESPLPGDQTWENRGENR